MGQTNRYESPLSSRYASDEMLYLFSADKKFTTWRRLWVALARAEMELGLPVTAEQVAELESHINDINYDVAAAEEKKLRHDVMAHVHAYGAQCPKAMPIIHLGATSCYVGDNTDVILMREGLLLIRNKLVRVLHTLSSFTDKYKALPTLGFTHFQPAQLVTVGKRASLWMNDLLMDLEEVEYRISTLKLLGSKGTTGTQASFLELFDGDHEKVKLLEEKIAKEMGFTAVVPVSGQTYSRKMDANVLATLSGIAQSASKFATDMRLLCHLKEVEEPFEKNQIGSSAMAYKRNPMRSERICALSRHVMALTQDASMTAATQWFERTLDDSANRRLSLPEAFLATDAVLELYANIADGMVVYPKMIARRVNENLPFMATEDIIMESVKNGGDRQEIHERVRVHSQAAAMRMKQDGLESDLLDRIADDPAFPMSREALTALLAPEKYTGRAEEQTERFIKKVVDPILEKQEAKTIGEIKI